MPKSLKSKEYWYGVYKHAMYPILKDLVEDTEEKKWDDALLESIDKIVDRLMGPDEDE